MRQPTTARSASDPNTALDLHLLLVDSGSLLLAAAGSSGEGEDQPLYQQSQTRLS